MLEVQECTEMLAKGGKQLLFLRLAAPCEHTLEICLHGSTTVQSAAGWAELLVGLGPVGKHWTMSWQVETLEEKTPCFFTSLTVSFKLLVSIITLFCTVLLSAPESVQLMPNFPPAVKMEENQYLICELGIEIFCNLIKGLFKSPKVCVCVFLFPSQVCNYVWLYVSVWQCTKQNQEWLSL